MNGEDKLFDLMTKMYADLKGSQEKMYTEMKEGFKSINDCLDGVEDRLNKVETKLENNIETKIDALFDGYKQNADKLDRIEKEVLKHDEIILRKVNP
ncbi:hypothetical protein [Alkaliphilus crotonatoxidans]